MSDNFARRGTAYMLPHHESYDQLTQWLLPQNSQVALYVRNHPRVLGRFKWCFSLEGDPSNLDNEHSAIREALLDDAYIFTFCPEQTFNFQDVLWGYEDIAPDYVASIQREYSAEIAAYRQESPTHLWYHCPTFEIIFDSRFQHPSSQFAYSAIRMDTRKTRRQRQQYYHKNYNQIWPVMGEITDFAMLLSHNLISLEPTCMGDMAMRRIMFGSCLNYACMSFSLVAIICANYRARYPSFYVFPWMLANFLAYIYTYEYDTDPIHNYAFWTSWTNDPADTNAFLHLNIPTDLLKEEKMTFMQLEDLDYRKTINNFFCNVSTIVCARTLFWRLKFKDTAGDIAWEVLKRKVGETTGRGIYYTIGSRYHRCTYKPEAGFPERILSWLTIITISTVFILPLFRRLKRSFHEKTRWKNKLNEITFRSITGGRRYYKMVEPIYNVYRHKYPRDEVVARDAWYLSQRYRHTPTRHQNIC